MRLSSHVTSFIYPLYHETPYRMAKITVTRPIPEAALEPLRAAHDVAVYGQEPDVVADEALLIEWAREADALITVLSDPVTPRVLDACPNLKVVAQCAVGYDNIDLAAAEQRGVVVTNTPDVLTETTADFAFALLLGVARRICEADQYVREGRFQRWETMTLLGTDLHGKTFGIFGMGRIGGAAARRALGFGMRVLYHNRHRANPTVERYAGAQYVSFEELLSESDVISIHAPLNEESRHRFDAAAFQQMKPSALLINTARGPLVDEAALVDALAAGEIAGAGLDVFEREPEVHPGLFEQERVLLAPHLGSATIETRTGMGRMCADAVLAVLGGEDEVPHRVV